MARSYPRSVFEFNVGVLRWTWRVQFYTVGAFATDRYPPFTLADDPAYPAHLEVACPGRLSRRLVLVKWWLLAIPHYIIVGLFTGGGLWVAWHADQHNSSWPGLIGCLAIVAAVVLLVTGGYPQQIFDLVLGLNRWVLGIGAALAVTLLVQRASPALASFTVSRESGGLIAVTIRDLNNPNALLRELRHDGVRASFTSPPIFTRTKAINRSCLRTMTPMTRRVLSIRASADPRQAAFLLRPAAIPAGDELDIYWAGYSPRGYARTTMGASVGVGSKRYRIPLTIAGPFAFQAGLVTRGGRCV